MIDQEKIKKAVHLLIEAIGEDPTRAGLAGTPERMARMYAEIFGGIGSNPSEEIQLFPTENEDEMIIVRDLPFYSMCEHHLLPFWGFVSIAYIPKNNLVTGFSSLARIVHLYATRPQLQERMTVEIAETLMATLKPLGVFVVLRAQHLCLMMRGEKVHGTWTVTSAMRGAMRREATRLEALHLMDGK
ncbi:MAG: GTP cyclohydrolase I FolE [bacterium]